ncbi:MAG: nucleoside kinase [Anaerolineales bacterium]|nr:nucleoside kinase [Chloroflexota bacterium]MBL6982197.1 nucleoside kinase [Anaerolineales bacterium]
MVKILTRSMLDESKKNSETSPFKFVEPRQSIEIHLPDERVITGPRGATTGEFLVALEEEFDVTIVGAVVNGSLRELTFPLEYDSLVRPITMRDADGMRFYRRSLTFLLETAFHQLFPKAILAIDHSVASGGYFCQVFNSPSLEKSDLDKLEVRMRELVSADLPFVREKVPLDEAIAYFEKKGYEDKIRLLEHRQKEYLILYKMGDHRDYHHGYMVPSSGYLQWFRLTPLGDGFVMQFPRRHLPTDILPLPDYRTLVNTFRQYGDWLQRLGIDNVGTLNQAIREKRSREVILISEALHEGRISEIASQIYERLNEIRVVLIAGPSSSGKTTFSKRLTVQLLARGISPFPLEMDKYFVDREETPLDENGEFDFETIKAVNTKMLGEDIQRLIAGERVQLSHYDFKTGMSSPGEVVQLRPGQIIILEGIHGLNPELIPNIPSEQTFRIYASALTQLNLDWHNRVSTTDTRLIRRIVRDARERGYSAQDTIKRWESVRRGEKRYIFPYQDNADVMFNSALVYELAALKPLALPELRQVPFGTPEHVEAKRLLSLLEWFQPIDVSVIPDNSLLREFIGTSILKGLKIWAN